MSVAHSHDAADPQPLPQLDRDAADPREVGDLLGVWLSIKMDEVDLAVETARDKQATIPDWRVLSTLLGELTIRVHALELEVEDLRRSRR
jgi:hypothetical protein